MLKIVTKQAGSKRGYGPYCRIAIVELEDGFEGEPKMISERAKGVVRVVRDFGDVFVGKTERSAYHRALKEAEEILEGLLSGERDEWGCRVK